MPTNESGMLTREQIENFRMHAKARMCPAGFTQDSIDSLCDMALSALSRQQGEAVAWQEIARKTIMQMFDVNSHDAELAVKCISEQLPAPALSPAQGVGWVKVSDQLPEIGEHVLCAYEFDAPQDWRVKMGAYVLPGIWRIWGASWRPTHWQPLPLPPKD